MSHDSRDYGLPNSQVIGVPRVLRVLSEKIDGSQPECGRCGCQTLCEIEVHVEQRLVRGGKGIGKYLGCPACPWASPMVIFSDRGSN